MESLSQNHLRFCMIKHRHRLSKELRRFKKAKSSNHSHHSQQDDSLEKVMNSFERSISEAALRKSKVPAITYPESLPVVQKRQDILEAIKRHQVVVLAGETGSGKTTQLPKICLELGLGVYGLIGHTQPRRLAARSVAQRISDELNVSLGEQVGYQVRFTDQSQPNTLIKLMTDGILLAEIQQDPFLSKYEVIIIDEAHERSLNIDFLMGYLKRLLPKRRDLKVIITSATIDVERFSLHFDQAPILQVSGRSYPVHVEYRPSQESTDQESGESAIEVDLSLQQQILNVVREIESLEKSGQSPPLGDILVFLSGEREIRETADKLRRASLRQTEIIPLYARLSGAEQQKVFASHSGRRIVLSTNVAETSLTVPGIRYVIDTGLARVSRYSYRSKVQRLPIEPISQASANQRKGRCGRVAEGICYRLYSEEDFLSRELFTDAEILRTNLASVILQMHHLNLGDISEFPFVDKPDSRFIKDGVNLLQSLGAIDTNTKCLTKLGRKLARLPTDPRLARMILAAADQNCLQEVLVITSVLSIQDPRERPVEKQQQADEKHRLYAHEESDFLSFVQLWQAYETERETLSKSQLRKFCKTQFLSFMRMQEWREIHWQLKLVCKELKLEFNQNPANYEQIHKALLTGLLDHIGNKNDEGEYLGARNKKFIIFPGSKLAKKKPKWIIAAELMETSRLFARTVGKVDPDWIEPIAKHLINKKYFEPHWEKKRQQVVAFEKVSLFGLTVVPKRKVNFGKIDPLEARNIFIQSGLVEGGIGSSFEFLEKNNELIFNIEELENKSRRRDILVDDQTQFAFYDRKLPEHVHQTATLKQWLKQQHNQSSLLMSETDLMAHSADDVTLDRFPDVLIHEGVTFPLEYRFDPTHPYDGVMLKTAPSFLYQVPFHRLEWLVPGMLRDKCIALVKALPKSVRRQLVPVPDFVDRAMDNLVMSDHPLTDALSHQFKRLSGVVIHSEDWQIDTVPQNLRMTVAVMDDDGVVIDADKDLHLLIERNAGRGQQQASQQGNESLEHSGLKGWPESLPVIPKVQEVEQSGMTLKTYPAFVDEIKDVSLKLFAEPQFAKEQHTKGVIRLIYWQLQPVLRNFDKRWNLLKNASVYYKDFGVTEQLVNDASYNVIWELFLDIQDELFQTREDFLTSCDQIKQNLDECIEKKNVLVIKILEAHHRIKKRLKEKMTLDAAYVLSDVKSQIERLIYSGFLRETSPADLGNYPRYLEAIEIRLDKFRSQLQKERFWTEELNAFWQKCHSLEESYQQQNRGLGEISRFRWLLEEYRVSLFAQKLGTQMPISAKRLDKIWANYKIG